jgi:hypothetical protein
MPRWLTRAVTQIRRLAAARKVRFTLKARRELAALELGMDEEDACDVLANLRAAHSAGRLVSATTGEWMYLFKPSVAGTICYVKVVVRNHCIVISFHGDEDAIDDQEGQSPEDPAG